MTATFVPFDAADLTAWLAETRAEYVKERMASGDSRQEAEANATSSYERAFPQGSPASGQHVGQVVVDGQAVGFLWVGPAGDDASRWWVWDVAIDEARRGRGYGREAMLLAEELARSGGAVTVGLNVFAANAVARRLYTSLDYEESSVQMRKAIAPT